MDVRCERCNAQYAVDDGLVHEGGLAVRCAMCGHAFKVVKPQGWTLRKPSGDLYPVPDAATLQRWVVEGRVTREDELSEGGGPWERIGQRRELQPFFAVVDQARRGRTAPAEAGRAAEPAGTPAPIRDPRSQTGELSLGHGAGALPSEAWQGPTAAPSGVHEPAWASGPVAVPAGAGEKPRTNTKVVTAAPRDARPAPSRRRRWPILLLVFLLLVVLGVAAGAAVFWTLMPEALPPEVARLVEQWTPWRLDRAGRDGAPRTLAPMTPGVGPPGGRTVPPPPAPPVAEAPPAAAQPPPEAAPTAAPAPPPATPEPASPGTDAPTAPPAATASPGSDASGPAGAVPPAPAPAPPPARADASTAPPRAPEPATEEPPARTGPVRPRPAPVEAAPPVAKIAPVPLQRAAPPEPSKPAAPVVSKQSSLLAQARQARDAGRPSAALDLYGRALQTNAKNADALAGRGWAYLDLSSYRQAEDSFKAALEVNASHPAALMGLAETYRYEGKRADAVALYRRYLAAHPKGEDAAAARKMMEALEDRP